MADETDETSGRVFSLDEAHLLMPMVRQRTAEIIEIRADLAELAMELRSEGGSDSGGATEVRTPVTGRDMSGQGIPEAKALEAQLDELVSWFSDEGIEVKGLAPVLVDFPAVLDGVSVRLCWLEGETELGWYHRTELGFVGRRPLGHTLATGDDGT